jgi:hypothetical protein
MRRLIVSWMGVVALLVLAAGVRGQDLLVPAGTLLQCTMSEPNFSSATASVGDPVLCHLKSFQEFGRTVFPRGSMLAGHLEADKEPGHFVGKGYLKITFDRVIVPTGDLPLPTKVIAAHGYKVDKQGDIKGNGHAKRDVVEWMIPPLWPWKLIMLPARGPRPAMKGEEPMELRLMDDIVVPRNLTAQLYHSDRPPYASQNMRPTSFSPVRPPNAIQPANTTASTPIVTAAAPAASVSNPAFVNASTAPGAPAPKTTDPVPHVTILVLTSNQVLEVTKYRIDGGLLNYRALNGTEGSVDETLIDWRASTEMTSQLRSVDLPFMARQTN